MASGAEPAVAYERPMQGTVLIVDDDGATRDLCRDVVTESGLRTRTASTTEEALEILDQYPIDIVLTDLRIPHWAASSCSSESATCIRRRRSWS